MAGLYQIGVNMRFNEFAFSDVADYSKNLFNQAGYYTVGDSTAVNLAATGSPWVSKAKAGATSSNPIHIQALDSIPKGSIVAIAVGADDAINSKDTPEQVVSNAQSLISHAKSKGLFPVFLLFGATQNKTDQRISQIRDALKNNIKTAMLDMGSGNGIAAFSTVASQLTSSFFPNKGYDPTQIIKSKGQGFQTYKNKIKGKWPAFKELGFEDALNKAAAELGVDPRHLVAIMKQESGLNPQAVNKSSRATGLIQFMPKTASSLGTSTDALYRMTAVQQLPWVVKYFKRNGIKPGMDLGDLYMAVFYPAAIGKPNGYVLGRAGAKGFSGSVYRQNKGLDSDHDGAVTVADVKRAVMRFA